MSRKIVVALVATCTVLVLTACAPGGRPSGAHSSLPAPLPRPSHSTGAPSATPSAPPASPAHLSTTPGDELLTFTGTGHSTDGSAVAITFTLHAPVAWNSPAGSQTLAALAADSSARVGNPAEDLRNTTWDAAKAVSLAVVDYSATMVTGSWREPVGITIGPAESEVSVEGVRVSTSDDWWNLTGPGSGHFVIAFTNADAGTPDPSTWGDALQMYGLGAPVEGANPASYEFRDCRIALTPLGRRSAAAASWGGPTPDYCYAGVGE